MYALGKNGVEDKTWSKIKELNENLCASVKTKFGETREIKCKDSIRQGGVLSPVMYATMMDEIAKEITRNNLGITVNENSKIGCLLWMDDVALIANKEQEMQAMLDITNAIAEDYHIVFGKEKSKVLCMNGSTQRSFKIGLQEIEPCDKYKYLGVMMNKKNNLQDHIKEVKKKAEGAFQIAMTIAGCVDLKGIEMRTMWQLLESCIIPIIIYGGEACRSTKKEKKEWNKVLDDLIKRLILVPTTTPREIIYLESGLLDIEHTIMKNKLNLRQRIEEKGTETQKVIIKDITKNSWNEELKKTLEESQIESDQTKKDKENRKQTIKRIMVQKMRDQEQNKSKVKFYIENNKDLSGKRKKYLDECNRWEASHILKARARMINVKANYKGKFRDTICRFCQLQEETQIHIMEECEQINREEMPVINRNDLFQEDTVKLKETAKVIQKIESLLKLV